MLFVPPSGEAGQGQGGGGDPAGGRGEGGHHHQRVDGLLSLLRVHATDSHLRQRQVAGRCSAGDGFICGFVHPLWSSDKCRKCHVLLGSLVGVGV